jgi:hypothetical protein
MSRRLNIEIETADRELEARIFETSSFSAGETRITLSDGSTVTYAGTLVRKSIGIPDVTHLVIELATGVGTGVVGNWLYGKLKGRPAKLRVNRTEVEIEPNKIRIVIEQIEREG